MEEIHHPISIKEACERKTKILFTSTRPCPYCDEGSDCYRCRGTRSIMIKENKVVDITFFDSFVTHGNKVIVSVQQPYFFKDNNLCYRITINLTDLICGFRHKLDHPDHPNTVLLFPRGNVPDVTSYYVFDGIYMVIDVIYPSKVKAVPKHTAFTWKNLEEMLGVRPVSQIDCHNIIMIDMTKLDRIAINAL